VEQEETDIERIQAQGHDRREQRRRMVPPVYSCCTPAWYAGCTVALRR
jgi:hypothetical protein